MRSHLSLLLIGCSLFIISFPLNAMLAKLLAGERTESIVTNNCGDYKLSIDIIKKNCAKKAIHKEDKLLIHPDDFCNLLQNYPIFTNSNKFIPDIIVHQNDNVAYRITNLQCALQIAQKLTHDDDALAFIGSKGIFHLRSNSIIDFDKKCMQNSVIPYDNIVKRTFIDDKDQFYYEYYSNADLKQIEESTSKKIEHTPVLSTENTPSIKNSDFSINLDNKDRCFFPNSSTPVKEIKSDEYGSLSAENTPSTTPRNTPGHSPDKAEFFPEKLEI